MKLLTYNTEIQLILGEYIDLTIDIPNTTLNCAIRNIVDSFRAETLKARLLNLYTSKYKCEELRIIEASDKSCQLLFNTDDFPLQVLE